MGMEFKSNIPEVMKKLKSAKENVDGQTITEIDLFNDDFLKKYTSFNSLEDFKVQLPISIKEAMQAPSDELDNFLLEKTKFSTWKELYEAAVKELLAKKFKAGLNL